MTIRVRLFARARELAGTDAVSVELPPGATIADLRTALREACPTLGSLLPRSAVAVNEDFAADDAVIEHGAELAFLPPVSGGSGEWAKIR